MPVKGGKKVKASKAEKADTADKPKRKAALGTLAWTAYVKHCKTTMPDSFEGLTKESDKLVIVKGIRAEDPEGYKAFTEAWKTEHGETSSVDDSASVAETASVAEAEEPVPAPAKKPAKTAPKTAAPTPAPKVAAAPKVATPKVAAPKAAEKPAAAKKPVKKEVKKVVAEVPPMPQKEIDGVSYWHDPETNALWVVTGPTVADGTGAFSGYFQPGNEEEPIRHAENFGDE